MQFFTLLDNIGSPKKTNYGGKNAFAIKKLPSITLLCNKPWWLGKREERKVRIIVFYSLEIAADLMTVLFY